MRLEEAMSMLIQTQTAFLGRMADSDRRMAESDRRIAESERRTIEFERATIERFERIEKNIEAILRILAEHGRLLERLPEALRDKIGFKG